jgi:hypothetical protein
MAIRFGTAKGSIFCKLAALKIGVKSTIIAALIAVVIKSFKNKFIQDKP